MENILETIVSRKKKEVTQLKSELAQLTSHPLHSILKGERRGERGVFESALRAPGLSVIAEVKRGSPSAGSFREIPDLSELTKLYVEGGASAISVLTDREGFGGSLEDLKRVRKGTSLPLLRKDFIIDAVQIAEAIQAGASAVLIIVAAAQEKTEELLSDAERMGIDALVEVYDERELDTLLNLEGVRLVVINNRNLKTFEVDLNRALDLKPLIPPHMVSVAASGIKSVEDAERMGAAGYDAVLIGEALIESENPGEMIARIRGKG